MTIILIEPISTCTKNGSVAEVTGIDVSDVDCIHGTVDGTRVRWNIDGTCRNDNGGRNIDTDCSEISDLIKTIKKLQA